MGNTQDICILYGAVLTWNFLHADEQMVAAERHQVMEETAELNILYTLEKSWFQNGSQKMYCFWAVVGRDRRIFVSSRPAWSSRASSRTGSKATEKPSLNKQTNFHNKCGPCDIINVDHDTFSKILQ